MWYIYRYMIGDQWIYVGKTESHLEQRIYDHANDKRFAPYKNATIQFCEVGSRSNMDVTELLLIKLMHPVINHNDQTRVPLPFNYDESKVRWVDYKKGKSAKRIVPGDKVLTATIDDVLEFLHEQSNNEEYVIYSGLYYATYKIPRSVVYNAFSITDVAHMPTVVSQFNDLFNKDREVGDKEIFCRQDFANTAFIFEIYS